MLLGLILIGTVSIINYAGEHYNGFKILIDTPSWTIIDFIMGVGVDINGNLITLKQYFELVIISGGSVVGSALQLQIGLIIAIIITPVLFGLVVLFLIILIFLYKIKRFKFEINDIISDNLLKIGKKNYKFSNKNFFALFNEIKSLVLDKRYKYLYKFKKKYKEGNLNNELFDIVKKYYLKNEKELKLTR